MVSILRHRVVVAATVASAVISAFALTGLRHTAPPVLQVETTLAARLESYAAPIATRGPIVAGAAMIEAGKLAYGRSRDGD